MSAAEIARAVRAGETSAVDVARAAIERIRAQDEAINAVREVTESGAMAAAARIDEAVARGEDPGRLAGVPVLIKDNLCVSAGDGGGATCAGSWMLEGFESPYTATAVRRLLDAGAVIVGRANMDEFAMGSSGEHCAFGVTRNPRDTGRVPGGSSSGSAAGVAAGYVPLALGSDTGGSIRQPAAHCGVVGFKPSYGRVSRYGLIAFASSLDQVGPITATVEDAVLASEVLCGWDERDATSSKNAAMRVDTSDGDAPLRVGVVREAMGDGASPAVRSAVERAAKAVEDAGGEVVEVSLPRLELGIDAYYLVAPVEAASNLARYDGVRYGRRAELSPGDGLLDMYVKSRSAGFGEEVQRRIVLGTYAARAGYADKYYERALRVRRLLKDDVDALMRTAGNDGGVDALLLPTTAGPAFKLGEKLTDPLEMYLEDVFTVLANLIGGCAISVPMGSVGVEGVELPIGVQVMGGWGCDEVVLRVAGVIECV